jgi:hypothetical protein
MQEPKLGDYGLTEEQFKEYSRRGYSNTRNYIYLAISSVIWLSILITICINTGWPEEGKILSSIVGLFIFGFFSLVASIILGGVLIAIFEGVRDSSDENYRNFNKYNKDLREYESWWIRNQADYWRRMDGKRFEQEIAMLYSQLGYEAQLTSHSNDQGVDIYLRKGNENIIVQCKAHNKRIGPAVARELYGTLKDSNANKAILATLEGVSSGAEAFIKGKPIKVITVNDIIRMRKQLDEHQ